MRRGYTTEEKWRQGAEIPPRDTSYSTGAEAYSDGWTKTPGFAGNGETYTDHVCRPVIVDAEGRKRPIISYTPNPNSECIVTETETIVERVYATPAVAEYKYSAPTKVETIKDYGVVNQGWGNYPGNPSQNLSPKVDGFLTKVQTEASRPSKPGPMMNVNWRQTASPTDYNGSNGYSGYSDNSSGQWNRPSGNTVRQPRVDGGSSQEGWGRSNRTGYDGSLTRPTGDLDTAVNYLKEAAQSLSVTGAGKQYPYSVQPPAGPKVDNFIPTIDSREAARRYSGFPTSSQPVYSAEPTIDSREAARRYRGKVL